MRHPAQCKEASGDGRECYVCYYDFARQDYVAGGIPIPRTFKTNIRPGEVVDVLAVMKGNKLKVIDFV